MATSTPTVSPLRQRMIEDMRMRKLRIPDERDRGFRSNVTADSGGS
jgi:hypothetical protein